MRKKLAEVPLDAAKGQEEEAVAVVGGVGARGGVGVVERGGGVCRSRAGR